MTREERRQMWAQRMEDFRASGQTVTRWCEDHDIHPNQLRYWLLKSRAKEQPGTTRWLPVTMDPGGESSPITLRVGKTAIEVRPGFDRGLLQELVATLEELC